MYLIFVTNNNPGSWFIRWFTRSEYSHVVLVYNNEVIEATFWHGVHKQSLDVILKSYKKILFREVENVDSAKAWSFAESQIGKPYDWLSLLGMFFRHRWTSTKAWFCSELVACALFEGGVTIIRKEANRVTPENLLNSPLIKPIGEV